MIGRLVNFKQLHILAADDRDDHTFRALHTHAIKQRIGNSAFSCIQSAGLTLGLACAHHGLTHFAHHRAHIGKVEIDQAGHHHQIGDRTHALLQNLIGELKRFLEGCFRLGNQEEVLVRNDDQSVDMLFQLFDTGFRSPHPARAFEQKRLGHNTNGEHTHVARSLGNDRSSTCASAAAHTSCDKHHVDAIKRVFNLFDRFFSSRLANLWPRTCS